MTGHDHTNRQESSGSSQAKNFRDMTWYLKARLKPVADVKDPLTRLNRCILDAYLKAVVEDGRARTGFRYNNQSEDDTVSSVAAEEFGQTVTAAQVRLVRNFIASLFSTSEMSEDDFLRTRAFFFGVPEEKAPGRSKRAVQPEARR